jgi:hypothetical protein
MVTTRFRRDRQPVEVGNHQAQSLQRPHGLIHRGVRQDKQKFLAAIAADFVDRPDVGEHGDGEGSQYLVADRMTKPVIDPLERVEIDHGDRTWSLATLGPVDFLVQYLHDASPIVDPGQFVQISKLFDPRIGAFEFAAVLVERLAHRTAIEARRCKAAQRGYKTRQREEMLHPGEHRHADGLVGHQEQDREADRRIGPDKCDLPRRRAKPRMMKLMHTK